MTKLCPRGKAAAKRKFKVYPSAYANAYASKICAGKIKDPSGVKRKDFRGSKAEGGLMEATSRLKRQGLKFGSEKQVGKSISEKPINRRPQQDRKVKDDDFTKDAKTFKKFVDASRAAKVESAKDKVSPMKAQRHFMDTSKYRQKENVKKMFETGADPKTGEKLKTKISLNRIKSTFKNRPELLKEKVEDFYKPFKEKRNLAKGGRAMLKGGGICKRGMNRKAVGKNS